jgi:hypothetical protein
MATDTSKLGSPYSAFAFSATCRGNLMNSLTTAVSIHAAATARLRNDPAVPKSAISSDLRQLRQLRRGCRISIANPLAGMTDGDYVESFLKTLPTLPALPFSSNIKGVRTAGRFPLLAEPAVAPCGASRSRSHSAFLVLTSAGPNNGRRPHHYAPHSRADTKTHSHSSWVMDARNSDASVHLPLCPRRLTPLHPTNVTCEVTVSSIHVRSGNAPSLLTNVKNPRARKLHCRAGAGVLGCKVLGRD